MRFAVSNFQATVKLSSWLASGCLAAEIRTGLPMSSCSSGSGNSPAVVNSSVASTGAAASDPQVHQALENSCFDCHSERGASTWNATLAPSYLFGASSARRALNFSEWQSYTADKRKAERLAIAKTVADGAMPPGDYDFLHPAARLTANQKQLVLQWAAEAKPAH